MKLTPKLKAWAVKHADVAPDADDATCKKAIADALLNDDLSEKKFAELSRTDEDDNADGIKSLLSRVGSSLDRFTEVLTKAPADDAEDDEEVAPVAKKGGKKAPAPTEDDTDADEGVKTPTSTAAKTPTRLEKMIASMSTPGIMSYDDGAEKSIDIRVKEAAESYSTTKSAMVFPQTYGNGMKAHPFAGQPVKDYTDPGAGGRQLHNPSDLDKAVSGAFAKFLVNQARLGSKNLAFSHLQQHDRELLLYAMENMPWGGTTDKTAENGGEENIKHRKLLPHEQKALIDDSTSGGLEAAPIVFDDMVIETPLLHGELFPLVNTIPIERGRRIEAAAIGNVTGGWGGIDDTAITLFNTAAYVTAFDTTIFRWEGAIRIGLDFLSDTPVDFAQTITRQYGERLLEDLDDVIATGNGTTQPEGVMTKSGTTAINFGSATSLGNYESLRFGVSKAEHRANVVNTAVFCGTETSYQRAKSIPVGASDARRLSNTGNMPDYADYRWMGIPYKINESMTNTKVFYAILAKYRMYRRRGLSMRTSTEGDTLIRNNEMLLVAMARYGGQLERGAVACVTTSAQA